MPGLRKRIRDMYAAFIEYDEALLLGDEDDSVNKELAWFATLKELWAKSLSMPQVS